MGQRQYQGVGKKPAGAHYAQGWLGLVVKALFLNGDTDK